MIFIGKEVVCLLKNINNGVLINVVVVVVRESILISFIDLESGFLYIVFYLLIDLLDFVDMYWKCKLNLGEFLNNVF